ncbi:hypothetical protein ACFZCY_11250 [Streptomyces sp. NPDC007983]|uniref:hypothetical protein n=1 Tax=Streptomyces sp. NPDC007983 TaxID=3364800 RepID=UPI0036E5063C
MDLRAHFGNEVFDPNLGVSPSTREPQTVGLVSGEPSAVEEAVNGVAQVFGTHLVEERVQSGADLRPCKAVLGGVDIVQCPPLLLGDVYASQ